MFSLFIFSMCFFFCFYSPTASGYNLVHRYDYTNWFTSFIYEDLPDPTHGAVQYISLEDAQDLGLTKIIGSQVFMGVDNTTVLSTYDVQRKSLWLESHDEFLHGLLIGDFAHIPGSNCGTRPGFWTIRNGHGTYGEIDIIESFSDETVNYMTLHTGGNCSFKTSLDTITGTLNQNFTDCDLGGPGCSFQGPEESYGTPFNDNGGGVYAMEWTSIYINIYFFPRNAILDDIVNGDLDLSSWGKPAGSFDSRFGNCDIDANFPPQTIYFDTTFCGAEAGGDSWSQWTDCSTRTGYSTCEEFVAQVPSAFDDAYWLINSVQVYQ